MTFKTILSPNFQLKMSPPRFPLAADDFKLKKGARIRWEVLVRA
jgi:hypothetical protein